jgi:hypothetical protein
MEKRTCDHCGHFTYTHRVMLMVDGTAMNTYALCVPCFNTVHAATIGPQRAA